MICSKCKVKCFECDLKRKKKKFGFSLDFFFRDSFKIERKFFIDFQEK